MTAVFRPKVYLAYYKILLTKTLQKHWKILKKEMLGKSIKRWKTWLLTDIGNLDSYTLNSFKMTDCIGTMYKLQALWLSLLLFNVNCIWTNL